MTKTPKVALIHDWFTVDGGAEKVFKEIHLMYPDADVFSLIDFLNAEDRENILLGKKSNVSVIQHFPLSKKYYRYYLPWFPYAIEQLNLDKYDLVISSSYAVAKGILTNTTQTHICYCHSPMRYLWDLYFSYIMKSKWYNFPVAFLMRNYISKLRQWDVISSNRVDHFISNSKNISERIQKVYRRDSKVIYPPINVDAFNIAEEKEDYFVTASRLVPYKKVDIIVKAFTKMPDKKLIVVGDGPEFTKLQKISSGFANISLTGYISSSELEKTIARSTAFINASNEDFGIAPVEAQACGVPIIAYAKGGILETTVENKTAVYYHEQDSNSIVEAVKLFEKTTLDSPLEIRNFALKFKREHFRSEFEKFIQECTSKG